MSFFLFFYLFSGKLYVLATLFYRPSKSLCFKFYSNYFLLNLIFKFSPCSKLKKRDNLLIRFGHDTWRKMSETLKRKKFMELNVEGRRGRKKENLVGRD